MVTATMEINTETQFCGVIGNPIAHSLSPAIHNAAFRTLGLNFVYLAWQVEAIGDALNGLRALGNFRGASVTIPHKVAALPFLDEVEPTARHIGAINTVVSGGGTLIGHNTDATGVLRALREGGVVLKGKKVTILGTGGAARAIAFALATEGSIQHLNLLGIEESEREALARDLHSKTTLRVDHGFLDETALKRILPACDVLIHCTPIGMSPKTEATCVPAAVLHPSLTVMDIVYNPWETKLLGDAKCQGCRTISGLEMFLYQAAAQFELWTGRPAPLDVMRSVLESRFS
ncbi:MAG TPA: shikimate dehydrogenase [Nitrospira sp.]|nr:shikimate dehydrogenase [Nitrospira sp.]